MGDVVFVELPSADAEVKRGGEFTTLPGPSIARCREYRSDAGMCTSDQIGSVESVKAASDIYAPVSGIVQSVNKELDDTPSLLNKSPEDKGKLWLRQAFLSRLTQRFSIHQAGFAKSSLAIRRKSRPFSAKRRTKLTVRDRNTKCVKLYPFTARRGA